MPARKPKPVQPVQCGSCIFREDGKALALESGRLDDIRSYLIQGTQHYCHNPALKGKKDIIICRGAREWQLTMWHRLGLIDEPTDEALNKKMVELGLWTT